jgi:hypothetical protein
MQVRFCWDLLRILILVQLHVERMRAVSRVYHLIALEERGYLFFLKTRYLV